MINGRAGVNNFTSVSIEGETVVDYIVLPHEQLQLATDVIDNLKQEEYAKIRDHLLLELTLNVQCQKDIQDVEMVGKIYLKRRVKYLFQDYLQTSLSVKKHEEDIVY